MVELNRIFNSLNGDITYTPTKNSLLKRQLERRAYRLAREEREVKLKEITSDHI